MSNTNHIIDIHHAASKEMRAQRLKRLRKTTGLSRKDFSKKYDISPGTLQNWETARGANMLTENRRMQTATKELYRLAERTNAR